MNPEMRRRQFRENPVLDRKSELPRHEGRAHRSRRRTIASRSRSSSQRRARAGSRSVNPDVFHSTTVPQDRPASISRSRLSKSPILAVSS